MLESTFTQGGGGFEMKDGDEFVRVVNIRNAIGTYLSRLLYLYELFSLAEHRVTEFSKN